MATGVTPLPTNTGTSSAGSFTSQANTADPFTASNVTWSQTTASTSAAWAGFYLTARIGSAAQGIIQVGTGAASSETIIATLPLGLSYRGGRGMTYYVPIPIATSTRIAVGGHSSSAVTMEYQIIGQPSANFDSEPSFTVLETGPYDLDNYSGLLKTIDPGGTANTKAGWTELSFTGGTNRSNNVLNGDSLGQNYDYIGFILGTPQDASIGDHNRLWSFGHGAASSETAFVTDLYQRIDSNENMSSSGIFYMPRSGAPASTARIAFDLQSSTGTASDRVGTCVMVGVR